MLLVTTFGSATADELSDDDISDPAMPTVANMKMLAVDLSRCDPKTIQEDATWQSSSSSTSATADNNSSASSGSGSRESSGSSTWDFLGASRLSGTFCRRNSSGKGGLRFRRASSDSNRSALKQLSASSPAMTAATAAPASSATGPAAAAGAASGTAASAAAASSAAAANSSADGVSGQALAEESVAVASPSPGSTSSVGSAVSPLVAANAMAPVPLPLPSPGSSKARQKKFHRHFKSVDADERVINYYSCALVADILLQGHLYITKNYFAFYSNVFGYVTKLLIPTVSVVQVSKEKTARIIPNAVGISTETNKHVFGSLLSRDSTYKLMVQVWELAMSTSATPVLELPPSKEVPDDAMEDSLSGDLLLAEDDDSSLSGSGLECPVEPPISPEIQTESPTRPLVTASSSPFVLAAATAAATTAATATAAASERSSERVSDSLPRPTVLLLVTTALLVLLFTFAGVLLYRIGQIQEQLGVHRDDLYPDLVRWQSQLHTRSASQVEQFLDTHLNQLAKVRQSLEALSLLIVDSEDSAGMMPSALQQQPQENGNQAEEHRKEHARSLDDESLEQWTGSSAQSSKTS